MSKYKRFVEYGFMAIFLLGMIGLATHFYPQTAQKTEALPTPAPTQPALRQDPQVVAVMQHLGLDYSRLNLIYGDNPSSTHDASFVTPNTVYITSKVRPDSLNILVSHEYLHYVQYINRSEEQALYPSIQRTMDTNTYLQQRIASYPVCDTNCFTRQDEAMAYACTEMPDSALQPDFVAWCNKYLPQRSLLSSQ